MKLNRREFLALTGKTTAGAVIFAACGLPERELIVQSPVELPEDLVRGEDAWYATSMGDFTTGDGVLVRVMQGRAKKIEGNPDHPVNRGKATARYDSVLQLLYHPDRISEPMVRYSKNGSLVGISWDQADAQFRESLAGSSGALTVVTNPLRGHLGSVASNFAEQFGGKHMAFDPTEQGVLHSVVKSVLGQDRLPTFDISNAQTILSFGADWLGTSIEEWPDVSDPVGVFVDEDDGVWVISARLNRILKYNRDGELQYYWGAYGGTRGGFAGGLSRPHQLDVDQDGNVYIASWDGGWMDKFVPRPGADPAKLIGRQLVLDR